ncbi:nucleotide disphospho-sugar-binding domain-containing protein [Streptomyces sp. NPDC056503]|uniref:nucleotide disphospho-sugar-binding domain-containing protein n=1 Tax=Streptomyces sp. NPDC056503 TaxID=3345842 RepID=UPI0036A5624C
MRVLVTTSAVNSHLNNLVPMAWALRTAGHEVCVASQPSIADAIKHSGLTAVSVGDGLAAPRGGTEETDSPFGLGYDIAETDPARLTPDRVRATLAAYTSVVSEYMADGTMLKDLVRFARTWRPDLVLWDAHNYAAPVMARAVGAAHVRILPAPDHWARMRAHQLALAAEHSPAPAGPADDPMAAYLAGKLESVGLDPATFAEDLVVGQATIDPLPDWLGHPLDLDHRPVRHIPYTGPTVVPAWLRKEPKRRRVCLTLGQTRRSLGVTGTAGGEEITAADVLRHVADLDVEVVATLSADQLPPGTRIPDNVRLFDYVPLDALLPSCAAIVHYGGMGTVAASVVHGVPQLGIPGNIWGEAGVMRALEEQGAGLVGDPTGLVDQLARLLDDPAYAEGAAKARDAMLSRPSPRDLVPGLEELTARHRDSGDLNG